MNARTRNLVILSSAGIGLLFLFWRPQAPLGHPSDASIHSPPPPSSPTELMSPQGGAPSMRRAPAMVTHAVEVSRLHGFPPDASPGDVFEVWVAWNPPIVKGPNIQLLLNGVTLDRIAPPVTPEGPYVAFLLMPRRDAREFLYATRYGALSVTQPAPERAGAS